MQKIGITFFVLLIGMIFALWNVALNDYDYSVNVEIVNLEEEKIMKVIYVEEEEPLLDALSDEFEIEGQESSFGYFITRIDFIEQDTENNNYIMIYVNNTAAQVGIAQLELENDDTLSFILETYE